MNLRLSRKWFVEHNSIREGIFHKNVESRKNFKLVLQTQTVDNDLSEEYPWVDVPIIDDEESLKKANDTLKILNQGTKTDAT